jgi:hypothetical protein
MDLVHARVALRERPLLDVVDLAVRFCVANAGSYARVSLAVLVPGFAASWAAMRAGGWALGWALALALSALVDAPFVALASRLVFAERTRLREVLRAAAAATPRLLAARLGQLFAFLVCFVALGLPWLWVGSLLLFVPEVIVLEQSRPGAAWGRAARIAQAQLGIATAANIVLSTLFVAAPIVADAAGRELLGTFLEIRPPRALFDEGGSTLALLGFWLLVPLRATARFFVYLDVRTRTEGWDIQTRFAALAAREASEAEARTAAPPRAA